MKTVWAVIVDNRTIAEFEDETEAREWAKKHHPTAKIERKAPTITQHDGPPGPCIVPERP